MKKLLKENEKKIIHFLDDHYKIWIESKAIKYVSFTEIDELIVIKVIIRFNTFYVIFLDNKFNTVI